MFAYNANKKYGFFYILFTINYYRFLVLSVWELISSCAKLIVGRRLVFVIYITTSLSLTYLIQFHVTSAMLINEVLWHNNTSYIY